MTRYLMVALVAGGILGGTLRPEPAKAEAAEVCGDELWNAYNNCLMSTSSYWIQALCDVDFTLAWLACRGVRF